MEYLEGRKMKIFDMKDVFGAVCGDGTRALKFLNEEVLPLIAKGQTVEFDFVGVRILNSSFSNALFGNLMRTEGKQVLKDISITGACSMVKMEVKSGLTYGIKHTQLQAA
jgi:hypothetical protein